MYDLDDPYMLADVSLMMMLSFGLFFSDDLINGYETHFIRRSRTSVSTIMYELGSTGPPDALKPRRGTKFVDPQGGTQRLNDFESVCSFLKAILMQLSTSIRRRGREQGLIENKEI